MEIWDACLPNGILAGCDLVRGELIPNGLYHLVSEILARHTYGDFLLMQRDPRKPNYDGYFEAIAEVSARITKTGTPLCAVLGCYIV